MAGSQAQDYKLDAEKHAIEQCPKGLWIVVDGRYWRCRNIADNPELDFVLTSIMRWLKYLAKYRQLCIRIQWVVQQVLLTKRLATPPGCLGTFINARKAMVNYRTSIAAVGVRQS